MLLLTRPYLDAQRSRAALLRLGFEVRIESMFKMQYLLDRALVLSPYDMVVVTSRHAIEALAKCTDERGVRVVTVGDSTMKRSKYLGFSNVFSVNGTTDDLLSYFGTQVPGTRALYVRGEEISRDLCGEVATLGLKMREVVLYKTVARKSLSRDCRELLYAGKISGIVFYSARTARIFVELVEKCARFLRCVRAYSISRKALEILGAYEWKGVFIAPCPTEESLFGLIFNTERP